MEFRTLLILGLCACVAIAAPTDEDNENQGSGDSSDKSNETDVSAEEESDRRKLEHIIRVLDSVEDQLTEDEIDYLDDLLEGEHCEAAEDEHHRQKRQCGCDIPCCNALDGCTCTPPPPSTCSSNCRRNNCNVTCVNGQRASCRCTIFFSRGRCECI